MNKKIKVLSSDIFNRIAAGEVADKPASIVKELVENSIDAGATEIRILTVDGGITRIQVTDNGGGIAPEDIKTAFLPHATSKIVNAEDLDAISTLGFRGEALPSIAAVATVTMLSRMANRDVGTVYKIDNGVEVDFGEMGGPTGTTVTVDGLFEKIPARKKFLKKDNLEGKQIADLVTRLILANPNIAFTYIANGKTVYNSDGKDLNGAIKAVYGYGFLDNCVKIHSTMSDITLDGCVGKPSFSKHSKAYQTLIVNGRYVVNDEISFMIYGCYSQFLMRRQYPVYVLHLHIPYDLIDINVHPGKMEVKFASVGLIKKLIYQAIETQVLDAVRIPKTVTHTFSGQPDYLPLEGIIETETVKLNIERAVPVESKHIEKSKYEIDDTQKDFPKTDYGKFNLNKSNALQDRGEFSIFKESGDFKIDKIDPFMHSETLTSSKIEQQSGLNDFDTDDETINQTVQNHIQTSLFDSKSVLYVGKAFNTYLIVQSGQELYFIDQHAAHEKLNYDRICAILDAESTITQDLLLPFEFSLAPLEAEYFSKNIDMLNSFGFHIVKKTASLDEFLLLTVPAALSDVNLAKLVNELTQDFASDPELSKAIASVKDSRNFKDKLAQAACKASVKGEMELSQFEVDALLSEMTAKNMALFCPHGRPVVVKVTRDEIEKWFKRIV